MISFDFDRANIRRRLIFYGALFLVGITFVILSTGWFLSRAGGTGWLRALAILVIIAFEVRLVEGAWWVGVLSRGIRRKDAAIVVNDNGVVDNASVYALGELAWNEIEKIYPSDWNSRLIPNWKKTPVISRQRGIVVILKDSANLQRLLLAKPRLTRLLSKQWYVSGRRRSLFIPEAMLTVSADELMRRLNLFYVTEVRGHKSP